MLKPIAALLCFAAALSAGELSNRRAPGFSLPDSRAAQHDPQDYRGKVLLVDFMRTECPGCAAFADVLVRVRQKYGDRVGIISVVNPPDNQQSVAKFAAAHKVTTPIVFDCGQAAFSYLKSTNFAIPHVFLIDANGMIRDDWGHSPQTHDIFEGDGLFPHIDRLLAGAPAKPAAVKPAVPAKKK